MIDYLKSRLRRSPVKEDALLRREQSRDGVKNAQFVSFLQQSGFRKRALDRHDKTKRVKRFIGFATLWAVIIAATWVAYESAEAFEMF